MRLILGCHSHQPVGNFDFVFQEAYDKAYKPFIDVLEQYPAVKVTLHYTGPLWDWFLEHAPEYVERLKHLAQTGQVEIMGGAYYEPLLCAIPERDAIAQIRRMQSFCEKHLDVFPRGMWLTERVWEPHMPRILARAGVEYAALDDTHFLSSGVKQENLFGYYVTEDEGLSVKIFPISKKLRYLVPFHAVQESVDYLRKLDKPNSPRCLVVHDDGEKFGVWPGTYNSVYEQGWLKEFFDAITENQDWLTSQTYAEYLDQHPPIGRTYIQCASYHEMGEWALQPDMRRSLESLKATLNQHPDQEEHAELFVRGGFWRNFLGKYEESNNLQKRMLLTSNRFDTLKQQFPNHPKLAEAETLLHKGQCNCAYWHGVFGGLYLNHLRTAIYQQVIEADRVLDEVEGKSASWIQREQKDVDGDGRDEILLSNPLITLFIKPDDGGSLFELDYKPIPFNFCNLLTRRDEYYHDALRSAATQVEDRHEKAKSIHDIANAKEQGLEQFLVCDPYRRVSLRDHIYPPDVDTQALWQCTQPEWSNLHKATYQLEESADSVVMITECNAGPARKTRLSIQKAIAIPLDASDIEIRYDIRHVSGDELNAAFATELGFNFLAGAAHDRYYFAETWEGKQFQLNTHGKDVALQHIGMRDEWMGLSAELRLDTPADLHRFPLETVSNSEGGQERVYQGSMLVPCWPLNLKPGESKTCKISVALRQNK